MNSEESMTLVGTGIGTAVGWVYGGPIGGAVLGSLFGSLLGGFGSQRKQKAQQRALAEQQMEQARILRQKIKADNAGLYSAVQSSVAQTSGAMGAVY